jgi:hypothetical protein
MERYAMEIKLKGDKAIEQIPSIKDKALRINLNENIYGTFAEIGAGQETVRHFLDLVVHQEQLQKRCLPMTKTLAMPFMVLKKTVDMLQKVV